MSRVKHEQIRRIELLAQDLWDPRYHGVKRELGCHSKQSPPTVGVFSVLFVSLAMSGNNNFGH